MDLSRRAFLARTGAVGGALSGLRLMALGAPRRAADRFGRLERDPAGRLDLPAGFEYAVVSTAGEEMDDGLLVPGMPDGMAAFPGATPDEVVLVRNHELTAGAGGAFGPGNERLARVAPDRLYDAGHGRTPGCGGTTTVVWDVRRGARVRAFASLLGTVRNCAGGPTPWGSWISCEEAVDLPDATHERSHGWCFEVPADATGPVEPAPLTALGRFNHEAVAVDPATGIVYLTEDRDDSLFYRFLPDHVGALAEGGRLQALAIRGAASVDARNWNRFARFPVGEPVEVRWVDLEDTDAPADDLRQRGFLSGAARFARGEGTAFDDGTVWFACTSGGPNAAGQVWRYRPSEHEGAPRERVQGGTLELFLEPNHRRLVDMCDNLAIAPWGDLVLCEDGPEGDRLLGVDGRGDVYPLAENAASAGELAGATFSPDGSTLFVNAQTEGGTYAITGPWPEPRRR